MTESDRQILALLALILICSLAIAASVWIADAYTPEREMH
jgi:hypothetical protein